MSIFSRVRDGRVDPTIDPFADPVAYLADLGIEAELVAVLTILPAAA